MSTANLNKEQFAYQRIGSQIRNMIFEGVLQFGEKLPSVRGLAKKNSVSVSTVIQAYTLLESEQLIRAKPQSGYFVIYRSEDLLPEFQGMTPKYAPVEVRFNGLFHKLSFDQNEENMISFATSRADPNLLPVASLSRLIAKNARDHDVELGRYSFRTVEPEFARQLSLRYQTLGCAIPPSEFLATFGCTEALSLCLQAIANKGDIIAVENPTYHGVLEMIESLGMKALAVPTVPNDGACLDDLRELIEEYPVKACLFSSNYQNPLGYRMSEKRKRGIYEIIEDYDIPLIEDDIYGDLSFDGERPQPIKAHDKSGLVMLCSSFSKTLAPGMRLGWVAPGKFHKKVLGQKYSGSLETPLLPQRAMADYLKNGGYDRHLRNLRSAFCGIIQQTAKIISEHFPEGTLMTRPEGGNYLWVGLPKGVDAFDLFERAKAENILIIPGQAFSPCNVKGCSKTTDRIRITGGYELTEERVAALKKLGDICRDLMPE